ncbi:quinoprotein dehydrogenase-associated SoxYZ-like carrier [Thalassococcus sp. BH17M4-6]|uniref:quinoprotein dehydrogenase-associated SoxYZ-like carrier n=1 Tax=Thalassococcus sp. BH17M4-6 TaxID=3413148 RepID=UPI003BE50C3A
MRLIQAAAVAVLIAGSALAADDLPKNPLIDGESWADLRGDVVGDATIADGSAVFTVDAPYRAHDAATVPILIKQTDMDAHIARATVVIDENPAPVAGEFVFGDALAPLNFEMRVRVNQYSNVRVLAETDEGLLMNGRFVKASGGCSAPASRDPEVALASMGQMKLKLFGTEAQMSTPRREAQIMIRHPNYSGLQRDQITQLFIAAHFIDTIELYQGEDMLFTMTGGISISENPVFRFEYDDNGSTSLRVRATDTEGNVFEQELPKAAQS